MTDAEFMLSYVARKRFPTIWKEEQAPLNALEALGKYAKQSEGRWGDDIHWQLIEALRTFREAMEG